MGLTNPTPLLYNSLLDVWLVAKFKANVQAYPKLIPPFYQNKLLHVDLVSNTLHDNKIDTEQINNTMPSTTGATTI